MCGTSFSYAKETERERTEGGDWNRELINFLYVEGCYGSISPKDIRGQYQDRLRDAGLLKVDKSVYTKTVTNKLKKLGFQRDSKTTDNKTWFIIDQYTVLQRAFEYGIRDTPQQPNLLNLPNSNEEQKTPNEEKAEEENNKEIRSGESEPNENEEEKKLTKLDKLTNTGVLSCVCGKCFDTLEVLQHHQANCRDFQDKQSREARGRLDKERNVSEPEDLGELDFYKDALNQSNGERAKLQEEFDAMKARESEKNPVDDMISQLVNDPEVLRLLKKKLEELGS